MSNRDLSRPHTFSEGTNDRVLLLLHGTGGDEHDLVRLGKALDPDAALLSPRGMFVEAGMNRYFERYADGSFNEDSIDDAVADLAGFLAAAKAHYSLEGKRFYVVGFSNGANTGAALLVRYPELLDGAVLFGSTRPYGHLAPVDLSGKRIWLANGDQDPYAPVAKSADWVDQLTEFGARVEWLRHPLGHQISPAHVKEVSLALGARQ